MILSTDKNIFQAHSGCTSTFFNRAQATAATTTGGLFDWNTSAYFLSASPSLLSKDKNGVKRSSGTGKIMFELLSVDISFMV